MVVVRGDGDGWVECAQGHRHWGRHGAAGLLVRSSGPDGIERVLLQHRAPRSHFGDTWGLPGGARDSHEGSVATALREASEETGLALDGLRVLAVVRDDHGGWAYDTVVATCASPRPAGVRGWESTAVEWVPLPAIADLPLHPGFARSWPGLQTLPPALRLVVDAANVVGSRPDGWWRDRAGATRRLRDRLAVLAREGLPGDALPPPWEAARRMHRAVPAVVLVVEGAARAVTDDPASEVQIRPAAGSGDDEIVAQADGLDHDRVLVVTADRALRTRVAATGASVVGPGWLLSLLDALA